MEENIQKPRKSFPLTWLLVLLILAFSVVLVWALHRRAVQQENEKPITSLVPLAFQPLPLGSVKPAGWLLEQLKLQAGGLTGHLDEFWPDVKDSGWIGGKAEGWERAPYWLDGLVPTAYLLDDKRLKQKAERWMDYILKHQLPDGWLGPEQGAGPFGFNAPLQDPRDPWPQFIILKAMTQYEEATGDKRVIPAIEKSLQGLNVQLDRKPLDNWNFFRWGDFYVTIFWLYDHTGEPWLLDLARKVGSQGYNWPKHFSNLPIKEKSKGWNWEGHVVNNAMGLKTPALLYRLTGRDNFKKIASSAYEELDRWHGEANGLMSGDECLAGRSPSQGTELCAIVESMFSLETSISVLGNVEFADRLEKIAFNALPAAFTPDYWCHQYVEQSNQVLCAYLRQPIYTTNRGGANVFGLEPQFGCCLSNMHQGWPKFVSHLWMATPDHGLAAVAYAPCVVRTQVSGIPISIELKTDYPFSESLSFQVTAPQPVDFPLYLRVPGWAEGASLKLPDGSVQNLKPGSFQKLSRRWSGKETVVLSLPMSFRLRKGYQDAASVERGPLVFSLGLKEQWKIFQPFKWQPPGKPKNDFAVIPDSPWNYALDLDRNHPENSLTVKPGELKGNPFTLSGAPITVLARGKRLETWVMDQGVAMPPPQSPVNSLAPEENLVLVPYGSTRLRITEFPVLK